MSNVAFNFSLKVLLLEGQRGEDSSVAADDRSYVLLLYPQDLAPSANPDHYVVRVPFRSLLVGLLSHQMLLQTIGTLLIQGTPHVIPRYHKLLWVRDIILYYFDYCDTYTETSNSQAPIILFVHLCQPPEWVVAQAFTIATYFVPPLRGMLFFIRLSFMDWP